MGSDDFYAGFYENSASEKFLAVWHAPRIIYANDYMSYVTDYIKEGLTQKLLVDVTVSGVSPTTATLIPLDGTSSSSLTVESGVIKNIPLIGDMPVLIRL